jgi:hypothetical protein
MLILKGGVLLTALDARRPTRDIDFASASAVTIRDEDENNGVRVSMPAGISSAQIPFHIDVNVGDPIAPGAEKVKVPRMLNTTDYIVLLGYPISMVLAEKIVTAIQRGTANTRWRDFGDIYEVSRRHPIPFNELKTSVNAVAQHRVVEVTTLKEGLADFAEIDQTKYEKWRRKQDLLELPKTSVTF